MRTRRPPVDHPPRPHAPCDHQLPVARHRLRPDTRARPLTARELLDLQRTAGNQAVVALQLAPPTSAPPTGKRTGRPIADLEKEFRGLIAAARAKGYPVAASNLEHFLDGGGATKSVPLDWLRGFSVVTAAERTNQLRFETQLRQEAKGMSDGASKVFTDFWDRVIRALPTTELYYASGVSQLRSTGTFSLTRAGDNVVITGTVTQRWFDPYNWNPGMSAYIPGHGVVSDDVGLDLKDAGRGKDYLLENRYLQVVVGSYVFQPWYRPNTSTFTWFGP